LSALPIADAPALAPEARVTLVVRALLAALALGAALAFLFVSRSPATKTIVPLPSGADTIVVLDLSASISTETYSRIGGTLAALSRSSGRLGLVVFSDAAYEALPPGTPAADLAPLVRYFTLPAQGQPGFAPTFPTNPWLASFTSGTRISAGLTLAHQIAAGGPRHPEVVLISDLDDSPGDVTRLASVLLAYRRDALPLRIVALDPAPAKLAFFQRLAGPQAGSVVQAPLLASAAASRDSTPLPWVLVALAAAVAVVLAADALWAPRLTWRHG
jgi:hypothetical protein